MLVYELQFSRYYGIDRRRNLLPQGNIQRSVLCRYLYLQMHYLVICRYLHHFATPHIIHRDVKASNVLLDSNFNAQVADFGFAKLIPDGATHVTTRVKGTLGYLAPEYAMWGKVSESCDVYSFGILLLELISGKKPIERLGPTKRTIVEWAAPLVFHGKLDELVDPKLNGRFSEEELRRVVQVATMCAQNTPENRPTMLEVVELLKGEESRVAPTHINQGTAESNIQKLKLDTVKYGEELLAADEGSESNSGSGPLTADLSPSLKRSKEKAV
jgi:serine/threonine protein kinase